jgi:hypothetical protein
LKSNETFRNVSNNNFGKSDNSLEQIAEQPTPEQSVIEKKNAEKFANNVNYSKYK